MSDYDPHPGGGSHYDRREIVTLTWLGLRMAVSRALFSRSKIDIRRYAGL